MRPTYAEIDLGAIRHNVRAFKDLLAPSELCVVVKADAYGHGSVECSRALGLGDGGGVRTGLAPYTDDEDVDRLIEALEAITA